MSGRLSSSRGTIGESVVSEVKLLVRTAGAYVVFWLRRASKAGLIFVVPVLCNLTAQLLAWRRRSFEDLVPTLNPHEFRVHLEIFRTRQLPAANHVLFQPGQRQIVSQVAIGQRSEISDLFGCRQRCGALLQFRDEHALARLTVLELGVSNSHGPDAEPGAI